MHVRPVAPKHHLSPGVHHIPLRSEGSGLLSVPRSASGRRPFLLMLHGAGARAEQALALVRDCADENGLVVLAPQARGRSWDLVEGGYGPDVETIDDLLAVVFARIGIDPTQLSIGGFSDGASYALSLGLVNGDLFSHVLAFSPGFIAPARHGRSPRIFISHGKHDTVLPLQRCGGQIAPALRSAGHEVHYCEFDGGHEVPAHIRAQAVTWFTQSARASSAIAAQPVN